MNNNSKIISFLFSLVMLARCSSVTILEGKTFQTDKPEFRVAPELKQGVTEILSKIDYKQRAKSKRNPGYAFMPFEFAEDIDKKLLPVISQEIKTTWITSAGKETAISANWNESEALLSDLKSKDVDALVTTKIERAEDEIRITHTIKDPVNSTEFAAIKYDGKIISPEKKEKNSPRKADLYKNGHSYIFLKESRTEVINLNRPSASEISSALKKSVSARINVSTTSSDTILIADGKEAGTLPLNAFELGDGDHVLEFKKAGKENITRAIHLRAGETREVFHEWEDDDVLGALKIMSFPAGLKISWDGFIKGETPLFVNNLNADVYKIEFSRISETGHNMVLSEKAVTVSEKKISSLAFPTELYNAFEPESGNLWIPVGDGSILPVFENQLTFKKLKDNSSGWQGVSTHPLVPGIVDIKTIINSTDMTGEGKLALAFSVEDQETFVVEIEGKRASVYRFPSNGQSVGSYSYKKDEPEEGKSVRFVSYQDKEKNVLQIYLGNKMVHEFPLDFSKHWRLSLLTRGESPVLKKGFRSLSIVYPNFVLPKK